MYKSKKNSTKSRTHTTGRRIVAEGHGKL